MALCVSGSRAHVGSPDDNAVMSLSRDHPLGTSGEEHWPQNMLLYDQPQLCEAPHHCCYQGGGVSLTVFFPYVFLDPDNRGKHWL